MMPKSIEITSEKYSLGLYLLESILKKKIPERSYFKEFFGTDVEYIERLTGDFLQRQDIIFGRKIRASHAAPENINGARLKIEHDPLIRELDYYVNTAILPPRSSLEKIYGEFTNDAMKVYEYYIDSGKIRKCGIPAVTHPHNLVTTGHGLGFDLVGKISLLYHDVPEDFYKSLTKKWKMDSSLNGYDAFMDRAIPERIRNYINIITNKYDLIIDAIGDNLTKSEKIFNKDNVLDEIPIMLENLKTGLKKGSISTSLARTYAVAKTLPDSKNFKDSLKWGCYIDYLSDMASECIADPNNKYYLVYDMKGIDLYFNGVGRGALSMNEMIQNVLKQQTWVDKGYELKSDFNPLNEHISEIGAGALKFSREYIIMDFFNSIYQLSFFNSSLDKIRRLAPVFFEDLNTDYTIKRVV